MTVYNDTLTTNSYVLRLTVTETSTDAVANTSLVAWTLQLIKGTGSGRFSSYSNSWSTNIGGVTHSGTFTYDFRLYSSLTLGSGSVTIAHNTDGTKTISVAGTMTESVFNLGNGNATGSLVLTTIPRASIPTYSPNPVDAGTSTTITTNRADATFTHTISYAIGASSGTIGTGIGASTTWTPPLSLLNEIPSSTSGVVTITTQTYNASAVLVGTTTTSLTISVPTSVTPDFTTVTNSDTNSTVVSNVGAYVQNLSTLALAITGAAGAYSSTITTYKIEVAGQTINASSGTTTALATSGTYNITGTVTDSRGRTKVKTVSITVLAYTTPTIDTSVFQLRRSDVSGTPAPDSGLYIRTDLKADVQSLIVATVEKNAISYKVESRLHGTTTWTTKATVTPGGISFNSFDVESSYALTSSWDVQITVSDKFNSVSISGTVSVAAIFMHWGTGLGVGKFWERGGIDVQGTAYHKAGLQIADLTDLAALVPAGITVPYAGSSAPAGWLLCNGAAVSRTTYATLYAALVTSLGTVTVTIASPGVFTKTSHGLIIGDSVYLSTSGALPTGLAVLTRYYVVSTPTSSTFTVSATLGGTAINTTGTQSGTHTLIKSAWGIGDGSTTFNVPTLTGRTVVAVDTTQTEFAAIGEVGGAKTSGHSHTLSDAGQADISMTTNQVAMRRVTSAGFTNTHQVTVSGFTTNTGSSSTGAGLVGSTDSATINTQDPYVVMPYIIKT